MLNIRPAQAKDRPGIKKVLDAADLHYEGEGYDHFFVADDNGSILGIVRLEEHPDFSFLTSLGVLPEKEKRGIGASLVRYLQQKTAKPIYLYTIIPDYFRRLGFQESGPVAGLPAKEIYGCDQCFPGQCLTMIYKP